jgi:hypothetical protein
MLAAHVVHVFEEVWGRFWLVDALGLGPYLALNWLLFCLLVGIFAGILRGWPPAFALGAIYAGVMLVQGIGHGAGALVTGRYHGGFAGGVTGIALAIVGAALLREFRRHAATTGGDHATE